MPRDRTVIEKVSDWNTAFEAVRGAITPPELRNLIAQMAAIPVDATEVAAYVGLVQASMGIARIVAANDRASLVVAAMLTQSGVTRPSLDVIEGGEA